MGKINRFLFLSVNISKTAADTAKVAINDVNVYEVNIMGFPLTPRSMTLDDLELL